MRPSPPTVLILLTVTALTMSGLLVAGVEPLLRDRVALGLPFRVLGPERLSAGSEAIVTWDVSPANVRRTPSEKIELCRSRIFGVGCATLVSATPNDGAARVRVPATFPAGQAYLRLTARDVQGRLRPLFSAMRPVRVARRAVVQASPLPPLISSSAPTTSPPPPFPPNMDRQTGALRPPDLPVSGRLGVVLSSPRYNPFGKLGPTILTDGAADARGIGFRTIKVNMESEVLRQPIYQFSDAMLSGVRTLTDLARLSPYRTLFQMPFFRTFVVTTDVIGSRGYRRGGFQQGPLTGEEKKAIYAQFFELSKHLLSTYRGTNKIFILQNHEADNHTLAQCLPNAREAEPDPVTLGNFRDFFRLRQQAMNAARLEVRAPDVYLYHMCEVNAAVKSFEGGKRTVTSDVLPDVPCDLVGYSAYDSMYAGRGLFERALTYVRDHARDSAAFGANNVVISEIGVPEQVVLTPRQQPKYQSAQDAFRTAIAKQVPWILQWTLYDNECYEDPHIPACVTDGPSRVVKFNASAEHCLGYWVRKPDGSFGEFFTSYRHLLTGE
jgi:hypothetical protein